MGLAFLLAALMSAPNARATGLPTSWTASVLPAKPLAPGARFTVSLKAQIEPGWHIYALEEPEGGPLATEIGLAEGDSLTLLSIDEVKPRFAPDVFYKQPTGFFEKSANFTLHLRLPRQPLPRDTALHIQVRYQSCSDKLCLPPRTETIAVPLAPILR